VNVSISQEEELRVAPHKHRLTIA